jgi:four helix bundle protein
MAPEFQRQLPRMPRTPIKTYRDLVVWDKAMNLGVAIYQFCENRRAPRYFVLMDQLQRSSGSVPSNIAEGYGRRSRGDYLRFIAIANGSLYELETLLMLARRIESGWKDDIDAMLEMSAEVGRMLIGPHRALKAGPAKP